MSTIRAFDLERAELPLGRTIGDNDCTYDSISVVALRLRTDEHDAWGYGDAVSHAAFTRDAWYLEPLPPREALLAGFERRWWPRLRGREVADLAPPDGVFGDPLDQAVDLAIWDLRGKAAGLPAWSLLAGSSAPRPVRAYGSLLDYPSSEEDAVALARSFAARGFSAVKVKVGAPDPARDLGRLRAVRDAVGEAVEISADANCAWSWREAAARLAAFGEAGIRLAYLEDALPHDAIDDYVRLAQATDVPLVGHDYAPDLAAAEALLESGALDRLRIGGGGIDGMRRLAAAARAGGRRVIVGNTLFEHGVHVAAASEHVDRLEFSDLAWNDVLLEPVRFEDGHVVAPRSPGLGLDPDPDALAALAR